MDIKEFAGLLEQVARNTSGPPDPVVQPSIDPHLVKDALKDVSKGGVKLLQRALGVAADGVIGNQTNTALDNADLETLCKAIVNSSTNTSSLSFNALSTEYTTLFATCVVSTQHQKEVKNIADKIKANMLVYDEVSRITAVPPNVIGIIHSLECNLSWERHLHNGDLLTGRTVNIPSGRPPTGNPPFTWVESALDAIHYAGLDEWTIWTPAGIAYILEKYNGFGYRLYTNIYSPYLWSYTNHYTKGKYNVDGHFDPNLVSGQAGGMAILKELMAA